jgi:hypothetical protein
MPIALLPELAKALTNVGGRLTPWNILAQLEEQLLRRARGAFLVRWFGRTVPERRLSLHIAIVNITDLRARYQQAKRSLPGPLPELNLFGPIAGAAGVAAGLFASPTGSILFAPYLHDVFAEMPERWWRDPLAMFYALVGNWIMPLAGPGLAVGLLAPVGILAAVALSIKGDRTSHLAIRLLGEVALLIDAFLGFWDQFQGPVEEIRNPLVRGIMQVLGRVATVFAHLLGAAGLLLVRLAPLIPNLVDQFRAALALGEAVVATLGEIISDLFDTLMAPFLAGRGILDTLMVIYGSILALPARMLDTVKTLLDGALSDFGMAFSTIATLIADYVSGVMDRIVSAFHMTPLGWTIDRITAIVALMPQFIRAMRNAPRMDAPVPEQRGWAGRAWDWTTGQVEDAAAYAATGGLTGEVNDLIDAFGALRMPGLPELDLPEFPALPTLPDTWVLGGTEPAVPDFGAEARRLLDEARAAAGPEPAEFLRHPPSGFAAERRALDAAGPPVLDATERGLRDMIYLAVGRVLPAALRIQAPAVRAIFDEIDATLYPDAPQDPHPDHPQQILPDSGRLQPQVAKLTIRASHRFAAPDLRVFRDRLVEVMGTQGYHVLDAG